MPTETISGKRLAANRANAAKSTGPRTPEGKTRSAQNSRKHGFTAANFAVVRLEELDAVAKLRDDLIDHYQPINSQELFALERLALAQNALLRAAALETGMFTTCLNETMNRDESMAYCMGDELIKDIEVTKAQNRAFGLAEGLYLRSRKSDVFTLVLRYQAQTERMYRRAVDDFERIRAQRRELPNEPTEPLQPEETIPLPTPEPNPPVGPVPGLPPVAEAPKSAAAPHPHGGNPRISGNQNGGLRDGSLREVNREGEAACEIGKDHLPAFRSTPCRR